jgi:hypothetical protein
MFCQSSMRSHWMWVMVTGALTCVSGSTSAVTMLIDCQALLVAQHLFGLENLQQAPAHEGAQDATAQGALCLGNGGLVNASGRVKDHAGGHHWKVGVFGHALCTPANIRGQAEGTKCNRF